MANKLKKLPNFLNKSPWLWRSCTQSRTLSFRHPNDIFRTINSAYDDEEDDYYDYDDEEDEEVTARDDMSNDEDQIEALVRGLRVRQGKRLFLELDETNSIMTTTTTVAVATVGGNYQVPFKESVAMAMESKDPYLDFKKSMEEMVEAQELKDWKGMERLLSWYLKANGKANHEFIIGAFVDLLVDLAFAASSNFSNNSSSPSPSPSPSPSSSTTSSILCSSSSSSTFPNSSSCSSSSSFRAPNSIISSNSVETAEEIVELECSCSSSSIRVVAPPCLSSLFEDEEEDIEEGF